jgi:hypothetical protein
MADRKNQAKSRVRLHCQVLAEGADGRDGDGSSGKQPLAKGRIGMKRCNPSRWSWGLIPILLVAFIVVAGEGPKIEQELARLREEVQESDRVVRAGVGVYEKFEHRIPCLND